VHNTRILIGGDFTHIGITQRNHIARLDANGTLDPLFNPDANGVVWSIVAQGAGQILVGGEFNDHGSGAISIGGAVRNHIARLRALGPMAGKADGFNPDANDTVLAMALQADGKILAGGFFNDRGSGAISIGGQVRNRIARLDGTTGEADLTFNPNVNGAVRSIVVQANGKILAGGDFNGANSVGTAMRNYIVRLGATGANAGIADAFDPSANEFIFSIAVQADGKILAGGTFHGTNSIGGQLRNNIARLEIDGRVDQTLLNLTTPPSNVYAIAVQPDGKILIGGGFTAILGVARSNIARLNPDGTLDLAFNPNASGTVYSIAVQADGQILVGGDFTTFAPNGGPPVSRFYLARLNLDGTLDLPFDPKPNGAVFSIVVQADGRILAGGNFTTLMPNGGSQLTRNRIVRLNPNGTPDIPFNPRPNLQVVSIAVQANGDILVGGYFGTLAPTGVPVARNRIARLRADGTLDPLFNPNANNAVFAIAVQADGKVLAGGVFTTLAPNGVPVSRNRIARLNPDGTLDPLFDPNADGSIRSIVGQADGKILAGGSFSTLAPNAGPPVTRNCIARLNPDGTLDLPFNPDASSGVLSIALQADGKVLAGGFFTIMGGQPRSPIARLSNDTPALQNLALTRQLVLFPFPRGVTWTRSGSSPQFTRVTFELSTNNVAYSPLGNGIATGSNWNLTGLNFPTGVNFYIRARGYYRGGYANGSESITESVRNAFLEPILAGNISTRFLLTATCCAEGSEGNGPLVPTGANVGIGGFIVTGSEPKHVLLRAIGPSLAQFGVPNVLADPVLELHGPDPFATITNNNWRDTQEAAILASGIPPANDLESAIDATLAPGAYTAVVRAQNGTGGVGLVEVYDLDQTVDSKLANLSTRAFVGTGDNIVIAGFILGAGGDGDGDGRIVVRGIGPSLTAFGVPDALANPTLELRDSNGTLLVANNDWQDDRAQAAELTAAGLAPTNSLESAVAMTLPPGAYTALLAGQNNGTGVGLVEVYDRGVP
jgi:uncharacterized delta-60 repeat protein